MANYGVIDLGSNSVRLVIFDVKDGISKKKPITCKDFRSIINDKVMAGLSAYVEAGEFTQEGIARAVDVLSGHLKRARYFNCVRTDIFATAVLRNCANSRKAIRAIEEAIGAPVNLLSARDEAHLSFTGASCDRTIEKGTVVDLGGGSTELIRVEEGRDFDDVSIGQGIRSPPTRDTWSSSCPRQTRSKQSSAPSSIKLQKHLLTSRSTVLRRFMASEEALVPPQSSTPR